MHWRCVWGRQDPEQSNINPRARTFCYLVVHRRVDSDSIGAGRQKSSKTSSSKACRLASSWDVDQRRAAEEPSQTSVIAAITAPNRLAGWLYAAKWRTDY